MSDSEYSNYTFPEWFLSSLGDSYPIEVMSCGKIFQKAVCTSAEFSAHQMISPWKELCAESYPHGPKAEYLGSCQFILQLRLLNWQIYAQKPIIKQFLQWGSWQGYRYSSLDLADELCLTKTFNSDLIQVQIHLLRLRSLDWEGISLKTWQSMLYRTSTRLSPGSEY